MKYILDTVSQVTACQLIVMSQSSYITQTWSTELVYGHRGITKHNYINVITALHSP